MYFSFKEIIVLGLYNILTHLTQHLLKGIGLFNHKIKLGVDGRAQTFSTLKSALSPKDNTIWFHCASLGEYEQGLPVFEEIKKTYRDHKIVLSFFSPSGYEVKKDSSIADVVIYLPLDTKSNAKRFLDIVNPDLSIFVKYEIWPNYLNTLKNRKKRALLISALFRKDQLYFKGHGKWMLNALKAFEHIFVQDDNSLSLLNAFEYHNVTRSGDTRFDRVSNQLNIDNDLTFLNTFKQDATCVVVGSSWPEDEKLLVPFINKSTIENVKYVIAPHNIKEQQIVNLMNAIEKKAVRYSQMDGVDLKTFDVFIIDTIGLLSKIYSYSDIAYVGGAVGNTGLHNTLEPAVFGVPILIGNNYSKFPEAKAMIENKGMFSISTQEELDERLNFLLNNEQERRNAGNQNLAYIEKNKGAVIQIMNFIRR